MDMQGDDVVVDKTTIHFEAYENNPQLQRYTSLQLAVLDKFSDVTYTINGKALTNNEVTLLLHVTLLQSSAEAVLEQTLGEIKSMYEEKFGHSITEELVEKDGIKFSLIHVALPSISSLSRPWRKSSPCIKSN